MKLTPEEEREVLRLRVEAATKAQRLAREREAWERLQYDFDHKPWCAVCGRPYRVGGKCSEENTLCLISSTRLGMGSADEVVTQSLFVCDACFGKVNLKQLVKAVGM